MTAGEAKAHAEAAEEEKKAKLAEAKKLARRGLSYAKIEQETGLSRGYLYSKGIKTSNPRGRPIEDSPERAEVIRLFDEENLSRQNIQELTGIKLGTINSWINRHAKTAAEKRSKEPAKGSVKYRMRLIDRKIAYHRQRINELSADKADLAKEGAGGVA